MADFDEQERNRFNEQGRNLRRTLNAMASEDAEKRLARLNGSRIPTSIVCEALRIDGGTLTNYTRKTELKLCSESSQGKKRMFCLVDVYQLALLNALVGSNHSPKSTSEMLNNLLFSEEIFRNLDFQRQHTSEGNSDSTFIPFKDDFSLDGVKKCFCEDVYRLPKIYRHRDLNNPIYVFHNKFMTNLEVSEENIDIDSLYSFTATVCIATKLFAWVDQQISFLLDPPPKPEGFSFKPSVNGADNPGGDNA